MEPAGGGVGDPAELAAGVQPGEHDLDAGQLRAGLDVDGDAASVVAYLSRAVGVQDDLDPGADAGKRLVHGVVDRLPQALHEAAGVGGPDVHAGPLADRLQSLQDGEVAGGVARVIEIRLPRRQGRLPPWSCWCTP